MISQTRKTKSEQREATRLLLIQTGRRLFTQDGYANTATEEIVKQAGVTRGALYYHFANKEGLFKAVLETIHQEVAQHIDDAASQHEDPWEQFVGGCHAFLTMGVDPHIQQIMLIDAPAVLGWEAWRNMDAVFSMALLRDVLEQLIADEVIEVQSVEALTHLLSGAMNEAVLWIARSQQPQQALTDAIKTLDVLLSACRKH